MDQECRSIARAWPLFASLALAACSTSGGTEPGSDASVPIGDGSIPRADGSACVPRTCEEAAFECGEQLDGCGGRLSCGSCDDDLVCDRGQCTPPGSITHERADNPFAGATFYVNPLYAANVAQSMATASEALRPAMEIVARTPTAVWLDRIAAIDPPEGMSLADHLDEALRQQLASDDPSAPMTVVIVVYDLPDRDCAALASNGELHSATGGMQRYRAEFIDRIAATLESNPAYRRLRVVTVIEPDSLPNLVTNTDTITACRDAVPVYREGVAYAISRLGALEHAYVYLDIAHSGWLGWEHGPRAATLYREVMTAAGGEDLVAGFVTNVANYSALSEPFDPYTDVGANMNLIVGFYEWNRMIDETRFAASLRTHFPNHGFVIDTGRNGWRTRGAREPIEVRTHRGNWCNIANAGIGERPRANPAPGIDAYFWVKPPGESDGTSDSTQTTPNEEGKRFDPMCGAEPVVRPLSSGAIPTDALGNAPHAGRWFHEQFVMLVENATPPLR